MKAVVFKKIFSASVGYILIIVLLGWGFFQMVSSVARLAASLTDFRIKTNTLDMRRQTLQESIRLFREREADISRIRLFLVDRQRPVLFIESMEDLAKKTNTTLDLGVSQPREGGHFLSFRVSVDGARRDVLSFLHLLELLPYYLIIDEFQFSTGGDDGGSRLVAEIRVKAS